MLLNNGLILCECHFGSTIVFINENRDLIYADPLMTVCLKKSLSVCMQSSSLLAFQGISAFVVQCFYGWRIKSLTNVRLLSFLVYALSTVQLCEYLRLRLGAISLTRLNSSGLHRYDNWRYHYPRVHPFGPYEGCFLGLVDWSIYDRRRDFSSFGLVFGEKKCHNVVIAITDLEQRKGRTGYRATDDIITKLTRSKASTYPIVS